MKKYNKLPLVLGALAGISLLSAGFAGWIVTGATATQAAEFVNITVGSVTDNRIKATLESPDANLQFDAKTGGTNNQIQASSDAKEDMEIGGKVKIEFNTPGNTNIGDVLKGFTFGVAFATPESNPLKTAVQTDKLIETPFDDLNTATKTTATFDVPFADYSTSHNNDVKNWEAPSDTYLKTSYTYTVDTSNKFATLEFKFGFRRGETFGHVNPVNTKINETTTIEKIIENLKKLNTNLNTKKDLLTIKVTPK